MRKFNMTRRGLLLSAPALALLPKTLIAETEAEAAAEPVETAPRNISSFRTQDWRDHFDDLGKATIVADTASRALHFWSGDGSTYKLYPTCAPWRTLRSPYNPVRSRIHSLCDSDDSRSDTTSARLSS